MSYLTGSQATLDLGSYENKVLEKSQIWMETEPRVQSSSRKLNFSKNGQKVRKSKYQSLVALFNFTTFLYFLPNILSKIVDFKANVSNIK